MFAVIVLIRLMASMTYTCVGDVMCGDSSVTVGTVTEPVEKNWWHGEMSSAWQIILRRLVIFWETHTPKLISLSPFNETVFHDSCLPICKNLISIFPRARSCGGTYF